MGLLRLTKYEGLGNDFLVLLPGPLEGVGCLGAAAAAALCERHTGIGADGLITLHASGDGTVAMQLRNADGGLAETSGNGLRCAALAALDSGVVRGPDVELDTAAGPARVRLLARDGTGGAVLAASMGRALLGPLRSGVLGRLARRVDVGNPHLVLYPEPGSEPLPVLRAAALAPLEHGIDGDAPAGLNVESVSLAGQTTWPRKSRLGDPGAFDAVELVVWERGAGETRACGSGSVAAAVALRAAGLVGDRVEVRNPGGSLRVELDGPAESPEATLTGPARLVARIEVDLDAMLHIATEGALAAS